MRTMEQRAKHYTLYKQNEMSFPRPQKFLLLEIYIYGL